MHPVVLPVMIITASHCQHNCIDVYIDLINININNYYLHYYSYADGEKYQLLLIYVGILLNVISNTQNGRPPFQCSCVQ
jgi:hypothetical protein